MVACSLLPACSVLPAIIVAGCTAVADPEALVVPEPGAADDATPFIPDADDRDPPTSPDPLDDDAGLRERAPTECTPSPTAGLVPLGETLDDAAQDPAGGTLLAKLEHGGWVGLPLRHTSFDAVVTGTVAETLVTQRFENTSDEAIEAVYTFPLPHDGAVDDYWMRVADRHARGVLLKREDARDVYDKAKKDGKTAGLLDQERPNIFTQSIANIPPGGAVVVGMHIVQPLRPDDGLYTLALPTVVGPRYIPGQPQPDAGASSGTGAATATDAVPDAARITPPVLARGFRTCGDLEVTVAVDMGTPLELQSPSHPVQVDRDDNEVVATLDERFALLNKDFVLSWRLPDTAPSATLMADPDPDGKGGWFTVTVTPPAHVQTEDAPRRELVFVVDNSGSMRGAPMATAKATMRRMLEGLQEGEAFQVLRFSENASALGTRMLEYSPKNVTDGLQYVEDMEGMGGTEMIAGIDAALSLPHDAKRVRYVVLLTDGYIGNEREIFSVVSAKIKDTRLFALGVGAAPNRYLLDGLARMGSGAAHYTDDGLGEAAVVDRLYAKLRAPALTDLSIAFDGLRVGVVAPERLPDLFPGEPVVFFGRYEGRLSGSAVVRGMRDGGRVDIPVDIHLGDAERVGGIESMWARTRIDDLLMNPKSMGDDGTIRERVQRSVVALSLRHRVLTEYTAFVAVDTATRVKGSGAGVTVVQGTDVVQGMAHEYVFGGPSRPTVPGAGSLGNVGSIGSGGGGGTASGYGRGSGAGFGGRGKRIPRVRQAKAQVRAALGRPIIRRIVAAHINEVRGCYNQALARDPAAHGRVVVQFVIAPDGSVSTAVVADSTVDDAVMSVCVAKAVRTWKFPVPVDGGNTMVRYPFVFALPGAALEVDD